MPGRPPAACRAPSVLHGRTAGSQSHLGQLGMRVLHNHTILGAEVFFFEPTLHLNRHTYRFAL